jgi:hypothetical protein
MLSALSSGFEPLGGKGISEGRVKTKGEPRSMKMRISVTIENEDGSAFADPTTVEVGVPEVEAFTSPQVFDQVFDQYERGVLEARNEVVEEATEKYLSAVGKKKTQSEREVQGGEVIFRPKDYTIDAEIGRMDVDTFEIKKGSKKEFSTKRDVFPETGPREAHKTVCFREFALFYPCDESYRKSAKALNRALRRKKGQEVKVRTIANLVEREGEQIQMHVEKKAEHILEDHGWTSDGIIRDQEKAFGSIKKEEVLLDQEKISQAIKELNRGQSEEKHIIMSELHETFEDPRAIKANISVDDVCCKKQKAEGRKKGSPAKERRAMVNNTVAHIQNTGAKTYMLNTPDVPHMMRIVLAFLLSNELLSEPGSLVFFTDGARDLRSAIQDAFIFVPFKIILDWFHLEVRRIGAC